MFGQHGVLVEPTRSCGRESVSFRSTLLSGGTYAPHKVTHPVPYGHRAPARRPPFDGDWRRLRAVHARAHAADPISQRHAGMVLVTP